MKSSFSALAKKFLATAALFLAAQLSATAAVDLGNAATNTPYDRFLAPVKQVFNAIHSEGASMDRVNSLMRQGRAFRYARSQQPYQPALPQETASRRCGDCKDKALWLMDQLQDQNVRFVIGKLTRGARDSHAWLLLEKDGQWYILDCTMLDHAVAVERANMNEYVPLYSYSKSAAYRHTDKAGLVAATASKGNKTGV